jgi:hypothetical protein
MPTKNIICGMILTSLIASFFSIHTIAQTNINPSDSSNKTVIVSLKNFSLHVLDNSSGNSLIGEQKGIPVALAKVNGGLKTNGEIDTGYPDNMSWSKINLLNGVEIGNGGTPLEEEPAVRGVVFKIRDKICDKNFKLKETDFEIKKATGYTCGAKCNNGICKGGIYIDRAIHGADDVPESFDSSRINSYAKYISHGCIRFSKQNVEKMKQLLGTGNHKLWIVVDDFSFGNFGTFSGGKYNSDSKTNDSTTTKPTAPVNPPKTEPSKKPTNNPSNEPAKVEPKPKANNPNEAECNKLNKEIRALEFDRNENKGKKLYAGHDAQITRRETSKSNLKCS